MKIDKIQIYSNALSKEMNIAIYVQEEYKDVNLPVLYFLHGRTGNENILQQLKLDYVASKLIKENNSADDYCLS